MGTLELGRAVELKAGDQRRAAEILTLDGEPMGSPTVTPVDLRQRLIARYYGHFCVRVAELCAQRGRPDLALVAYNTAAELYEREGLRDLAVAVRTGLTRLAVI